MAILKAGSTVNGKEILTTAGGTISGNLNITGNMLLKGSGNYGNKINFGDGDLVYLHEASDDVLTIRAKQIKLVTSDTSTSALTLNGSTIGGGSVTETVPVSMGGTGATTLTSGYALIGNGTSAITTRAITNNTSSTSSITANTNLITQNTLRYALNRTSGVAASNTSYTTFMARGISLQSSTPSSCTNGCMVVTYS